MNDEHSLYINMVYDRLLTDYHVSTKQIAKFRKILNLFPKGSFEYSKGKKDRKKYRMFRLDSAHKDYEESLQNMRRFRTLLKYGAWQYGMEKENERKVHWKWIEDHSNAVLDRDSFDEVTYYQSVTNGKETYRLNDVVKVDHEGESGSRPWIARIDRLYENQRGEKKMKMKWFYFWNQILNENGEEADKERIHESAQRMFGDRYPPTAGDVFEGKRNGGDNEVDCSVSAIQNKVYLMDNGAWKSRGFSDVVDGKIVFKCNYFYDAANFEFVQKRSSEKVDDATRLEMGMKAMGIELHENYDNLQGAMSNHDSDDGVVSDIRRTDADPSGFTVVKAEKPKSVRRRRRKSSSGSVGIVRADSGLCSDNDVIEDSPLPEFE